MRVLIVEPHADGLLDLAIRGERLGHQVRYWCKDFNPERCPVGRGLVTRVEDWRPSMMWADLVLVGSNAYAPQEFDAWQRRGVPIIGAPGEAAAFELDRVAGMRAFEEAKIPIPEYRHFQNLDEAVRYIRDRDMGFAVKPCGDVTDKTTSCVFKTAEEGIWRLSRWKRQGKKFPSGVIVQERVDGIEFAVGAWIGPNGFVPGWEQNFEEKRLFAGGIGPNCGEAGTVLHLVKKSQLADKVLSPLEDKIAALGFVGNVDVNCIIDAKGNPWPLEWTIRFGYPAINIETALHDDPLEFLAGVAHGDPPKTRRFDEIAVGVVMALPPYPHREDVGATVGVPIWGVTDGIEDNLHFAMAQSGRNGLETAGSYVLIATGTGDSIVKARSTAYRVLDRLTVPASPFWRNDIGGRLRGELPKLQAHGYAVGMSYA